MVNGNRATIKEEPFLVYVNFIFLGGQIINIIVIKLGSTFDLVQGFDSRLSKSIYINSGQT
jgi:hypothetical protein